MAKSRQTFHKRQRERALREKAQRKRARREERRTEKKDSLDDLIDPIESGPFANTDPSPSEQPPAQNFGPADN